MLCEWKRIAGIGVASRKKPFGKVENTGQSASPPRRRSIMAVSLGGGVRDIEAERGGVVEGVAAAREVDPVGGPRALRRRFIAVWKAFLSWEEEASGQRSRPILASLRGRWLVWPFLLLDVESPVSRVRGEPDCAHPARTLHDSGRAGFRMT